MDNWVEPRAGWGGLQPRLPAEVCRIAYLGASVTAQAEGYRPLLHEWFVRQFQQPHVAIGAAIGGVGAISGVFTMDDLVIRRRPDLCFIEFTTADMDGRTPRHEIGPVLEGMIRKLRASGCHVCILHLYRRDQTFAGHNATVLEYEKVADYYGIPTINVGRYIEASLLSHRFAVAALLQDVTHTTNVGAAVVVQAITQGLQAILGQARDSQSEARPDLQAGLYRNHYQRTAVVPASKSMVKGSGYLCNRPLSPLLRVFADLPGQRD